MRLDGRGNHDAQRKFSGMVLAVVGRTDRREQWSAQTRLEALVAGEPSWTELTLAGPGWARVPASSWPLTRHVGGGKAAVTTLLRKTSPPVPEAPGALQLDVIALSGPSGPGRHLPSSGSPFPSRAAPWFSRSRHAHGPQWGSRWPGDGIGVRQTQVPIWTLAPAVHVT